MILQDSSALKFSRFQIFCAFLTTVFLLVGAFFLFPRAFPLASLSLLVDRDEVCEIARTQALAHKIGPEQFDQATSFISDSKGMVFIERHDDGHKKLRSLMAEN